MRRFLILAAFALAGCNGSPTAPPPPPPPPPPPVPQTWTIAGRVTDAVSASPVPQAVVSVAGHDPVTTDGSGAWQIQGTGTLFSPPTASISVPGYLTRETAVAWRQGGRQDVVLDLLPERPPFVLDFYRQLVRNTYDAPEALEPLRRWTVNPSFYVNTFNPKTGEPISPEELDVIVQTLHRSVPQLTGGTLSVANVESGAAPREPRAGYININIVHEPDADYCGRAYVAQNPGEITLNYENCDSCGSRKIPAPVVAHELGHAMGFWHVRRGVMEPYLTGCSPRAAEFTEMEQLHARIAYQRPPGNLDPDRDPPGYAAQTTGESPVVICPRSSRIR